MKYMGSKARHAKELLPIILKDRKPGQWYVEPFVGGANMIDKVDGNRIGADANRYLIAMWRALLEGWIPPDYVSEEEWKDVRLHMDEKYPLHHIAFVRLWCSFGADWNGGYARGDDNKGNPRNYADEQKRHLLKQAPHLNGIIFKSVEYDLLKIPPNSIIYCDPPYAGTTKYATGGFDHDEFWQWCRDKIAEGHSVFVSEYSAPDDWICVWQKKVNNTLTKDTGSKQGVEKLFVHQSQI